MASTKVPPSLAAMLRRPSDTGWRNLSSTLRPMARWSLAVSLTLAP
jgi:hypothetical protein